MHRATALSLALCLVAAGTAFAAPKRVTDFADQTVTARDIVAALQPLRTRGLTIGDTEAEPPKISMQLRFGRNSSELTADAKKQLDAVGVALNAAELAGTSIVLSGHTDVTGHYERNVALSQRRADAVKAYLVSAHDVAAERLTAVGRGPNDLLDEAHPASPVNRRVQLAVAG